MRSTQNLRNLPHALYIYLVNVQTMRKIFSNFVCFSESPNFSRLARQIFKTSWQDFFNQGHFENALGYHRIDTP